MRMDWWHQLRSRLGFAQKVPIRVAPETAPAAKKALRFQALPDYVDWTAGDVLALRTFFRSDTGQKLVSVCGSRVHEEAMAEAAGDRTAPKAHGMDYLLRFQFNLASETTFAQVSGAQDTNPDTAGKSQDELAPAEPRRSF